MKRGTMTRIAIAAVCALATVGIAAGCGGGGGEGALGLIKDGTLTVGVDTPYPPFEIGQPPDISGYDIEVMNGIAKNLSLEVDYQDTGFATIFRDVAAGQFDAAAAASTIKPFREKVVDFTDPYYLTQQVLLVPEGSDIASVDDLGGKIVGAQDATTGETYANDETDASEVRGFPEGPNAISAMVTGQVDAVIIDQPVAVLATEKQGGIKIVQEIPTEEFYGFAVPPNKDALREAMNGALQKLKDDGTIAKLYDKYFGSKPPASVLKGKNDLLTE